MSASDFTSSIATWVPPWLLGERGKRVLSTLTLLVDSGMELAFQGLQARFPGVGTPEALPLIGRGRRITRGLTESDGAYAERLRRWLDDWRTAGNALTIARQVQAFLWPMRPQVRIVNQSGTWWTLRDDGSWYVVPTWPAVNWNWDGDASKPCRFWVIIYAVLPIEQGPAWGSASAPAWGAPGTNWGSTLAPEAVTQIRSIVRDFKSGGDRCEKIILAFDPASFSPYAAPGAPGMPDGTWGSAQKIVGGVVVPARLATALYFEGV